MKHVVTFPDIDTLVERMWGRHDLNRNPLVLTEVLRELGVDIKELIHEIARKLKERTMKEGYGREAKNGIIYGLELMKWHEPVNSKRELREALTIRMELIKKILEGKVWIEPVIGDFILRTEDNEEFSIRDGVVAKRR